jgi:hypothetical protein
MDSAKNWNAVKELFDAALEQGPEQRESFLLEKCPNSEVRSEVQRLLAEYDEAGKFLSVPVVEGFATVSSPSGEPHGGESPKWLRAGSTLGCYQILSLVGWAAWARSTVRPKPG